MTLDQFIDKYNNKFIDFDGAYGNQCFDLYRQYCKEVLDVPQSPPTGTKGAVVIKDTYLTQHFTKIENTPTGVPKKGDIVIWDTRYGQYGHVAIFVSGDENSFKAFSQNDPIGSACVIRTYNNYYGVNCWLKPIKEVSMVEVDSATFENLVTKSSAYDNFVSEGYAQVSDILAVTTRLSDDIERLQIDKEHLEEQVGALTFDKNKLAEQLLECQNQSSQTTVNIQEETTIAGKVGVLNGWTVDSNGVVVANYRIK